MKLSVSTLGCPEWDLQTICETCGENGYDGVDFRGYRGEIDVTRHPQFADRIEATRTALGDAGLAVTGLSSSIHLCVAEECEENLTEARRLIALADELDAERVRVFGGGDADAHSTAELARVGGETMREILALDGAGDLRWLVETHDDWTVSRDCQVLLDEMPDANTGLVWDAAHTMRLAGESPVETLDAIGERVEYVHLKDTVPAPGGDAHDGGWRFVLPGEGDLPIAATVRELDARGYDGWLVFEHEKRWHPSLADPEVAFPAFVEWFDAIERHGE